MLQLRALRPYTIQRGIGAVLELYQYALYWHLFNTRCIGAVLT